MDFYHAVTTHCKYNRIKRDFFLAEAEGVHLDANREARWELRNKATSYFEQILESTPENTHPTSYKASHRNKTSLALLHECMEEFMIDVLLLTCTRQSWSTSKMLHQLFVDNEWSSENWLEWWTIRTDCESRNFVLNARHFIFLNNCIKFKLAPFMFDLFF